MITPTRYPGRRLARSASLLGLGCAILAAGALAAQDKTRVQISKEDCARLAVYQKPEGVDYQPGRDVDGRPVVPADLNGGAVDLQIPQVIEFDLAINPVEFPDTEGPDSFDNTAFSVGRVSYDRQTGSLLFNGKPLSDPLAAELSRKCQQVQQGN